MFQLAAVAANFISRAEISGSSTRKAEKSSGLLDCLMAYNRSSNQAIKQTFGAIFCSTTQNSIHKLYSIQIKSIIYTTDLTTNLNGKHFKKISDIMPLIKSPGQKHRFLNYKKIRANQAVRDRETQFQIAPQSQINDFILLSGSNIKDKPVIINSRPHPNDPAQSQINDYMILSGSNIEDKPVIINSLPHPNDPAQSQINDYMILSGSNIKDKPVIINSLPHPNDPAIVQVQLPNGQHVMSHLSMPSLNPQQVPPMGTSGSYGNPFGTMGGTGGTGAVSSLAPGGPGPFMMGGGNQQPVPAQQKRWLSQPPQTQQQHKQPPQTQNHQGLVSV